MAIPFIYNVRNVTQRPVATLTTAIGVGLTVMIFIGALSLAAGFRKALTSTGSPCGSLIVSDDTSGGPVGRLSGFARVS